jgi:7-cyano-7-deazaguanine synthase
MKDKLIIVSGGMDSITLLHKHAQFIKLAVSFYYGQKHEKEIQCAVENCFMLEIPHITVDISAVGTLLKSDLLKNGGEIPEGHYEDLSMKRTVVPFRNGIMLSIAAGIAESNDCKEILIGNHAGDHAIYPDCRADFIAPMAEAIENGTYGKIQVYAPFLHMTKRQIAITGKSIDVDFSLTWSCYKGGTVHCGKCGTCTERKEALEGFDPTEYEA